MLRGFRPTSTPLFVTQCLLLAAAGATGSVIIKYTASYVSYPHNIAWYAAYVLLNLAMIYVTPTVLRAGPPLVGMVLRSSGVMLMTGWWGSLVFDEPLSLSWVLGALSITVGTWLVLLASRRHHHSTVVIAHSSHSTPPPPPPLTETFDYKAIPTPTTTTTTRTTTRTTTDLTPSFLPPPATTTATATTTTTTTVTPPLPGTVSPEQVNSHPSSSLEEGTEPLLPPDHHALGATAAKRLPFSWRKR
jgi:hypothetical protein